MPDITLDDWSIWLLLAGRGFGKTRAGAEAVIEWAMEEPGCRIHLVAATASDYRDVMVEGESGILECAPPGFRPQWTPSTRKLLFPNGSLATCFAAEEPRRLRGPQCHKAWCDEICAWERPETWDMMRFGLRLGKRPQAIVTTTPKPIPILRDLLKDPRAVITRGSTFDNEANLAPDFIHAIKQKYEGTRLGRQEMYADVLDDAAGALWSREMLDRARVQPEDFAAMVENGLQFVRIVVAIDPSVSTSESSDETGIVVCALMSDGHGYLLHDASGKYSPLEWAKKATELYDRFGADRIVAEVNQGGDLVEAVLRKFSPNIAYKGVSASRGKRTRAEPVSALSEQDRIHVVGMWPVLEDQLCTWDAVEQERESPDRLDAFVWAMTELMLQPTVRRNFRNLTAF